MPVLIHRLPFGPTPQPALWPVPLGDPIPIISDQIVVWISISPLGHDLRPNSPRFPAAFDSGFNNGCLIKIPQFISWTAAGTYEHCSRSSIVLRIGDEKIPTYYASVWLYPNISGTREANPNATPHCLDMPTGIAVVPADSKYAKPLPLLGLSAIRFNDMRVHIDGKHETVTIEVP